MNQGCFDESMKFQILQIMKTLKWLTQLTVCFKGEL